MLKLKTLKSNHQSKFWGGIMQEKVYEIIITYSWDIHRKHPQSLQSLWQYFRTLRFKNTFQYSQFNTLVNFQVGRNPDIH